MLFLTKPVLVVGCSEHEADQETQTNKFREGCQSPNQLYAFVACGLGAVVSWCMAVGPFIAISNELRRARKAGRANHILPGGNGLPLQVVRTNALPGMRDKRTTRDYGECDPSYLAEAAAVLEAWVKRVLALAAKSHPPASGHRTRQHK